jgi:hypothetical protein
VTYIYIDEEVVTTPVAHGLKNQSGELMIDRSIQDLYGHINDYWDNCELGVHKFTTLMSFAPDQEAELDPVGSAAKIVIKRTFDTVVEASAGLLGPMSFLVTGAKEIAEQWADDLAQAAKLAGQANLAQYISDLYGGIARQRELMQAELLRGKQRIIDKYREFQSEVPEDALETDTRVIGAAAGIINALRAGVAAFEKATPSPEAFQAQFSTAYANTLGWTKDGRATGRLHFHISLYKNGAQWTILEGQTSTDWVLVTKQLDPERVAANLLASLEGREVWTIGLEKTVTIKVIEEVWGANDRHHGSISFTKSLMHYENGGDVTSLGIIEEAWLRDETQDLIRGIKTLKGSNE